MIAAGLAASFEPTGSRQLVAYPAGAKDETIPYKIEQRSS